jgi:cytochrome c oxidase assembly protein subunit 11
VPDKNTRFALNLSAVVVGMVMLAYASVPLYRLFCQATGFGGTTQEAKHAPAHAIAREMTIDFNADTDHGLPWEFAPAQRSIKVKIGEQSVTHYIAHNTSAKALTGHAVYNVVPFGAGAYFTKIECFCFKEQTLAPGQRVNMPVVFFIDPSIVNDPEMKDVKTITLSYTFFPVKSQISKQP